MPNVILQSVENPACQRLLWDPLEPCGHQEEPSDETVELSELKERIGLGIRVWGLGFRGLGFRGSALNPTCIPKLYSIVGYEPLIIVPTPKRVGSGSPSNL